jgi:uncharacterized protein (UPF0335 family)
MSGVGRPVSLAQAFTSLQINTSGRVFESRKKENGMSETAEIGHNTGTSDRKLAKDQIRSIIERVERLEEEKKVISDDIKDVFTEAKGNGYDVKALRTIVRMRKMDASDRQEQEAVLETYMHAMGMI